MTQETMLAYSSMSYVRWKMRLWVGKFFNTFLESRRERERLHRIAYAEQARSIDGRLSAKQREEICIYLEQVKDLDLRREYFTTRPIDKTLSGLIMPLIEKVLRETVGATCVLNIGAYYSFVDNVLAARYPHVQFTAIDLLPSLEVFNAEFCHPNLRFISGYALELLEQNKIDADVTLFSATAAEIMNAELRHYFRLLSKKTKYLLLSEPVYPLPEGKILNPDSVDLQNSIPAYAQPDYLPHAMGPVAYVHNYRAMLKENGFEILQYRAFRPAITDLGWVHCIAENKGKI